VFAQVSGGFPITPDHAVSQRFWPSCVALVSRTGHAVEVLELPDVDLDRLDELCRRYGIARLEVFGSIARGEPDDGSDIDLLYELAPEARLGWEIVDLEDALADLFGRSVDLVSKRALHKKVRPTVLAEARLLFATR
jgi:predicted nucleotidyltransferase